MTTSGTASTSNKNSNAAATRFPAQRHRTAQGNELQRLQRIIDQYAMGDQSLQQLCQQHQLSEPRLHWLCTQDTVMAEALKGAINLRRQVQKYRWADTAAHKLMMLLQGYTVVESVVESALDNNTGEWRKLKRRNSRKQIHANLSAMNLALRLAEQEDSSSTNSNATSTMAILDLPDNFREYGQREEGGGEAEE